MPFCQIFFIKFIWFIEGVSTRNRSGEGWCWVESWQGGGGHQEHPGEDEGELGLG